MENTTHLFLARPVQLQQVPRPPVRALDAGPVLPDRRVLRAGRPQGRPGRQGAADRRHGRREGASRSTRSSPTCTTGEVKHERTGQVDRRRSSRSRPSTRPPSKATRREQLAAWITSKDNPYFARSYVNRLWGYLFGVGIIEPIDDIRAGNPPTNPELLDYLTEEFVKQRLQRPARDAADLQVADLSALGRDEQVERGRQDRTTRTPIARRLPAEVLYDAVYRVTGSVSKIPGVPPGPGRPSCPTRASSCRAASSTTFGRPPRESACECERTSGLQLGPVMALVSGPTIADAIADPEQRAGQAGRQREGRREAGRRAVPPHPEPAGDRGRDRGLRQGDRGRSTPTTRSWSPRWRSARPRSLRSAPQQEKEREEAIAAAKAELDAYEKEIAPRLAEAGEAARPSDRPADQGAEGVRGRRCRRDLAAWEKKPGRARSIGCRSDPRSLKATQRRQADPAARPLDRRHRARTARAIYTRHRRDRPEGDHGHPPGSPGRRRAPEKRPGPGHGRQLRPHRVRGRRPPRRRARRRRRRWRSQNAAGRLQPGELRRRRGRSTATTTPARAGPSSPKTGVTHWADVRDQGADRLRGRDAS